MKSSKYYTELHCSYIFPLFNSFIKYFTLTLGSAFFIQKLLLTFNGYMKVIIVKMIIIFSGHFIKVFRVHQLKIYNSKTPLVQFIFKCNYPEASPATW